jgi:Protein of unknown function with PCYCGC motif
MTKKIIWLIAGILLVAGLALALINSQERESKSTQSTVSTGPTRQPSMPAQLSPTAAKIPAHYETAPPLGNMVVTLDPEKFRGKAREAYRAVKDAPQLIAQMPCYCHCDRGMGHKSLYSCFEDDHAANCATCIDEALMAYQLQKRGVSVRQIREQIIAQFGD